MSQENVDFMREAFQAFARGELTALAELLDPDLEWRAVEDPEIRRGFEGVVASLGSWFDEKIVAFREYKTEQEALEAAGLEK